MKIIISNDQGEVEDVIWTDESGSLITSILEDLLDFHFDNENEYLEHIADRWDAIKEDLDASK